MRDSAAPRGSGPSRFEPVIRTYVPSRTHAGVMRSCEVVCRLDGQARPAKIVSGEAWRGSPGGPARPAKMDFGEMWRGRPAAQPAQPRPSSARHGEVAYVHKRPSPPSQDRSGEKWRGCSDGPARPAKTDSGKVLRGPAAQPAQPRQSSAWRGRPGGPARLDELRALQRNCFRKEWNAWQCGHRPPRFEFACA